MREFLFRGKRVDSGEWIYGDLIKNSIVDCFTYIAKGIGYKVDDKEIGYPIKVFSATVGQYTGLTDKNGTKVFEGDIIKGIRGGLSVITFSAYGFCFNIIPTKHQYPLTDIDQNEIIEIIGNIHDNPELLKGVE